MTQGMLIFATLLLDPGSTDCIEEGADGNPLVDVALPVATPDGTETGDVVPIVTVLEPMTNTPDGPRLIGVPEIVTPFPPGNIVVPAIEKAVGLAVKVWPPTAKMLD